MSYTLLLAFGVVLVAVFVHRLVKAARSPLRAIPGPWYAPFTDLHLKYFFAAGTIWKYVEKQHQLHGPCVRLGPRQIWISDKKALKEILLTTDLPKVSMYAEISRDKNNPGLFGEIRDEPHRRLKRFLSPAFTVKYVDGLEEIFLEVMRSLLAKYQLSVEKSSRHDGIDVDLMDDLHNLALDIMGECSLGKGFGQTNVNLANKTEMDDAWKSIPDAIFKGLARRYKLVFFKKFLRSLGLRVEFDWPKQMVSAIHTLVQQRKEGAQSERNDLLSYVLQEGKSPTTHAILSAREILDQMSELFLAGTETTSGTMACMFLEVARNPAVSKKLYSSLPMARYNDLENIVGSKFIRDSETYEYLDACIKENLRLHPIASEMGRTTGHGGVTLMNHDLPPYTIVSASYRNLHRDAEYWPEPLRFWPERWLPAEKRGGAPPANLDAYYPFSSGKHSCIGNNFAWAEMRIVAANLLSRYEIVEFKRQSIDFRQYITMQFTDGQWDVMLKPRGL